MLQTIRYIRHLTLVFPYSAYFNDVSTVILVTIRNVINQLFDIMHANDCRQKGYEIQRDNKNHIGQQDLILLRAMFVLKQFNSFYN